VENGQLALGELARALRLLEEEAADTARAVELLHPVRRAAHRNRVLQYGVEIGYRRALESNPENPAAQYGLGETLLLMGRPDQALERFREAVRLEPEHAGALTGMARVLISHPDPRARKPAEALHAAQRAVELTGRNDPRSLVVLADVYASTGRIDFAEAAAAAALPLAEASDDDALAGEIRRRLEALARLRAASPQPPTRR
jgi:cytochrome c-type biogenesis protein CcmH/NrfG